MAPNTYVGLLPSENRKFVAGALRENDLIETDYDRDRSEAIQACIEDYIEGLEWVLGQPDDSYLSHLHDTGEVSLFA